MEGPALVIESSFALIILLVTVSLAASLSIELRREFKHDYLNKAETSQSVLGNSGSSDDTLKLSDDLLFFDFKSKSKQRETLENRGWNFREGNFRPISKIKFYQKENQELLLINNLGVVSCFKNCKK